MLDPLQSTLLALAGHERGIERIIKVCRRVA
jgi:hypothetical protein